MVSRQASENGAIAEPGARLVAGRYRMHDVIGRGGAGVVWRATDELIGRLVAIKELRVPAALDPDDRSAMNARALRETRAAGQIRHPGVVAVHDIVPPTAEDEASYLVMELVDAPTLADILAREGNLPDARVAELGIQLLESLAATHSIGVVHRDVKPGNIMVLPGEEVKLVDFGIAHALDDTRLTRNGVMGSTAYLAPELFHGGIPGPAADIWSVGATLFHAVTGDGPFTRSSTAATMHAVLYDDLPPLACVAPLAAVITGLLAREVAERMTGPQAIALLRQVVDRPAGTRPPSPPAWETNPTAAQPKQAQADYATTYSRPHRRRTRHVFVAIAALVVLAIATYVVSLSSVDKGRYSSTPDACLLTNADLTGLMPDNTEIISRSRNRANFISDCDLKGRLVVGKYNESHGISITLRRFERGGFTSAVEKAQSYLSQQSRAARNVQLLPLGDEAFVGQEDTPEFPLPIAMLRRSNLVVEVVEEKVDDMRAGNPFLPETKARLTEFLRRCAATNTLR